MNKQNMNKQPKNKRVPKLRFPEFKNDEEWEERNLGDITFPISEKNKEQKKYPIFSINNSDGFIPQSEQFDGVDSHNRGYDISLYKKIDKNTFAYNPARINIGSIGYSGELHNIIISSLYVCFKTTKDIKDSFIWYFFKSHIFNESVKKNVEGGIRNYLFYENFARIRINFPSILEQQKIASCLSSLDELISAQSQKLEALKAHKKGLMQQLFPTEGETVPKLHFQEFKDSGKWEEKKLGEVARFVNEKIPLYELKLDNYISTENMLPDYQGVIPASKLPSTGSFTQFKKGDVLISNIRPYLKKVWFSTIDGAASNDIIVIRSETSLVELFLSVLLKNDTFISYIMKSAEGVKMPRGDKALIKEYAITFPSKKEQQKIASCLSSLDELITAQTEKIEALKMHKKGLMQQLFPS